MSTSRHSQPRRHRRPPGQPGRSRPAGRFQVSARHHHVTISATNAAYWVDRVRESAARARREIGPQAGAGLDEMADDLVACIAAGWRDREGRPVRQWQYHMWVAPHADGVLETIVQLWPEHLAA